MNLRICLFSGAALLLLAFISVGYVHPDEHFQILEPAAWRLNLTTADKLPWEFSHHMRPAIQPAMVVAIYRLFAFLGPPDPFIIALLLRLLSAGISFMAMWMIYRANAAKISDNILQRWFIPLSFLLWFALYNFVRFTSETWSGALFIMGFSFLFIREHKQSWRDYTVAGLLMGLSFVFRFQAGFLIAGFGLWLIFSPGSFLRRTVPDNRKQQVQQATYKKALHLSSMAAGMIAAVAAGVLIDRWFYGEWHLTAWNYLEQNILQDKISGFGIQPWWFYLKDIFIRAVPPFSLVYILSCMVVFIFLRNDALTWTLLPFILLHFIVGHKEIRFLFPLIGFLPVVIVKAVAYLQDHYKPNLVSHNYVKGAAKVFWFANIVLLLLCFLNPADNQVNLYKKIYRDYPGPVTLYYNTENPYHRAKEVNFYKRGSLVVKKAETPSAPEPYAISRYLIVFHDRGLTAGSHHEGKLIYRSYPEWIKRFNFNGWLDRTHFWYVFEVEK